MLHTLVQYAKRKGLDAEAGFTNKTIHWVIVLSARGKFRGVIPQPDPDNPKRVGREFKKVPHLRITNDPLRHFLVDSAGFALMFGSEDDPKVKEKHPLFVRNLMEAGKFDRRFRVIVDAITDRDTRKAICKALAEQDKPAKPADNVTFAVEEGGEPQILVA